MCAVTRYNVARMQIKVSTKVQYIWTWCVEPFFLERNAQDIKYNMRRMREIIFLEKVNTKHQVMYHCQKHTCNAANAYERDENINVQFMFWRSFLRKRLLEHQAGVYILPPWSFNEPCIILQYTQHGPLLNINHFLKFYIKV